MMMNDICMCPSHIDGQVLFGVEQFQCAEILFQPSLLAGTNIAAEWCARNTGLHHLCDEILSSCDTDLHRDQYRNMIIYGGTARLTGIGERLFDEVSALAYSTPERIAVSRANSIHPVAFASLDAQYSSWVGGSIVASLSTFQKQVITRAVTAI